MDWIYLSSGGNMISKSASGRNETIGSRVFGSRLTVFSLSRWNKSPLSILKHSRIIHRRGIRTREIFTEFFTSRESVLMIEGKKARCVPELPPISGQSKAISGYMSPKREKEKPYHNDIQQTTPTSESISITSKSPNTYSMFDPVSFPPLPPDPRHTFSRNLPSYLS